MDLESLYRAYKASRKHNRRSEDMVAFEVDLYANLCRLQQQVNSRTYSPLHNYSFMHRRSQKPREVFAAEPELKVMMAFALTNINSVLERHLSSRTFNNRVGMGAQLAVNTVIDDIVEVSQNYTKPCWIIKLDYKGYFPNMDRDYSLKTILDIVEKEYHKPDKPDVIYCLTQACYCDPKRASRKSPLWEWNDYPSYKSVYRRPPGIGGSIGFTFWQAIASLYPVIVDNFIEKNITPHFVRYVDDTVIVTDNKEMTLSMIAQVRQRLKDIGITLHPNKFYCQKAEHGVEFIGFRILPGRIHLKMRTIRRAFAVARGVERGKRSYMDAINSYLGMIKATSDLKWAKKLLDEVRRKGFEKDYTNYKITIKQP